MSQISNIIKSNIEIRESYAEFCKISPQNIINKVLEEMENYSTDDDVTMVAIKRI